MPLGHIKVLFMLASVGADELSDQRPNGDSRLSPSCSIGACYLQVGPRLSHSWTLDG